MDFCRQAFIWEEDRSYAISISSGENIVAAKNSCTSSTRITICTSKSNVGNAFLLFVCYGFIKKHEIGCQNTKKHLIDFMQKRSS